MRALKPVFFLLILLWFPAFLPGQQAISWKPLDEALSSAALAAGKDVEFVVLHQGQQVYRKKSTFFGSEGYLPIASASKWLSTAAILSLVDEGLLDLDDPVGLHLSYFREQKASITLRNLLTHTGGLGGDTPCLFEPRRSLDECVREIAGSPLLFHPGTAFHYGDVSLQVAARIAETVTGKPWNQIFRERIALPLGMERTTFLPGTFTANPQIASGAFSTADEYLRFLRMVRNRGVLDGQRVLSERALSLMLADQTGGTEILSTPYFASELWKAGASQNRYGLGNWLEGAEDALPDANSGQGAFGVSPYFDPHRDLIFLAFLRDERGVFQRYYYQAQAFLNSVYPAPSPSVPEASPFVPQSLTMGTGSRSWLEYVPVACRADGAPCPLLIALHPNGSNAAAFAASTNLHQLADRARIVIAAPNGLPAKPTPPEGLSATPQLLDWVPAMSISGDASRDDAAFLLQLSGVLESTGQIDPQRIYVAGFREGGDLAQHLVCRSPQHFAAFAAIRPALGFPAPDPSAAGALPCAPRETASALLFDAPFAEPSNDAEPSPSSFDFWHQHNRCDFKRSWQSIPPSTYTFTDAIGCWPGTALRSVSSSGPSAAWPENAWEITWEFFRARHRSGLPKGRFIATSAASFQRRASSPGALVSLFGTDLSPNTLFAQSTPLPLSLGSIRVEIRDRRGLTRPARLVMVSPLQVNLVLPQDIAPGPVSLFLYRGLDLTHRDWMVIDPLAPALFSASASGEGAPAAEVLFISPDGSRRTEPLTLPGEPGEPLSILPRPIDLTDQGTEVYLTLFGTGWSAAQGSETVEVFLGGVSLSPLFAGAQPHFEGLDQINVRLDGVALPEGEITVSVHAGKYVSNQLRMTLISRPAKPHGPAPLSLQRQF